MTESSAFWDGSTVGDAASGSYTAPYDAEVEFNRIWSRLLGSDQQGFVIPNVLNNLKPQASAPAAATVDVLSGAAWVKGFQYLNDAPVTLTIAANASGSPRLDRVVLRITWSTKQVRLAIVQGTPAATPTLPALTQVYGTTWEMPIAYIWVANGFATITDPEIHDERLFAANLNEAISLRTENVINNSEFMAFSYMEDGAAQTRPPDGWDLVGTPLVIYGATKPAVMSRGRYVSITADAANEGISQVHRVKVSTTYAIRLVHNVTAGKTGSVQVTTDSASPGTITRTLRRTGSDIEEWIYYTTESDATTLTIKLLCSANTDVVKYGQVICVEGFVPGPFRQCHETIIFTGLISDANWTTTAKSTGVTTITLSSDFKGIILPGTRAVLLRLAANDSGSAAGAGGGPVLIAQAVGNNYTQLWLSLNKLVNDAISQIQGWVPLDSSLRFELEVGASGALTLDASAFPVGIVI